MNHNIVLYFPNDLKITFNGPFPELDTDTDKENGQNEYEVVCTENFVDISLGLKEFILSKIKTRTVE